MVVPVVFSSVFKVGLVTTWKASCGKVWDCSRDTQTLNLSWNVTNIYAWQVVSLMNEQRSQNSLPKVDPFSTNRNNTQVDHSKHQPSWKSLYWIYLALLPLKQQYTRYGFLFLIFAAFRKQNNTYIFPQGAHTSSVSMTTLFGHK